MASLRTKVEQWKNRRTQSPGFPLRTKLHASSKQTPESRLIIASNTANDEIDPPAHKSPVSLAPQASNPNVLSHSSQSSEAWRRALRIVEKSDEWVKCCKIVKNRTGTQLPTSLGQGDAIADITQHITQLVESKKQSKSTRHQEVLDKTLSILNTVKDVGAGLVALNPYAAVGWGLVQYMVTVVSAGRAIQQECFEEFPRVIDLIIRYQTYEQLYTQSGSVQALKHDFETKLQDLYVSVLYYQVAVVITLFSPMTKVKTATAGEANSLYRAAFDDVQRKQNAWDSLRPLVDREISNAQFRKVQDSCDELNSISSAILHQLVSEKDRVQREAILNWISPISPENAHYESKRLPRPRTADWLLQHSGYVAWTEKPDLRCLWLQGFVGSGKSCLTHAVINDQRSRCQTDEELSQVLYFYCDGTDAERMRQIDNHEKILRSLVKQIAASCSVGPPPPCITDAYDLRNRGRPELTEAQCLDLLVAIADPTIDLKIIIDGIDECPTDVQLNLVESLRRLATQRCEALKVFIACRNTHDLDSILGSLARCTIDVSQHNAASVRMEIEARVSESLQIPHLRRLYWIGSRSLADKVIAKLTEKAGCMFRFVDSAFAYLHASGNAKLLENKLEDLSNLKGLTDLYDKIWDNAMASQNDMGKEVIITALTFVAHGFLYGVRGNDSAENRSFKSLISTWNSQHILEACAFVLNGCLDDAWTVEELLGVCPSFLKAPGPAVTEIETLDDDQGLDLPIIDGRKMGNIRRFRILENDLTLRIPHVSVTQYLFTRHSSHFNPATANARIATLCLRVFDLIVDYPDFQDAHPNGLVLYSAVTWPAHIRRSQSSGFNVRSAGPLASALSTFLPDGACSISFLRWASVMENFHQNIVMRGRALGSKEQEEDNKLYVSLALVTQPISSLFARIYLGLNLVTAEDHPCSIGLTGKYGETVFPQTFAALAGQPSSIGWLRSKGYSPNEQDELGRTSGHILCKEAFYDDSGCDFPSTLRALIEAGLDLNLKDKEGNTCFSYYLQSRNLDTEVLDLFRKAGFEIEAAELRQEPRFFLLDSAIALIPQPFRLSALKILLSYCANQFSNVRSRTRLLFLAVKHEDAQMAQYLIQEFGADPFVFNDAGLIPLQASLQQAISTKHLAPRVVDVLTPLTLTPELRVKNTVGFELSVIRAIQRECSWETVKLFIEYMAPIKEPPHCAWGPRPITEALLFNTKHGREIADNLWNRGCVNASNSRIYRKWRIKVLTDEEIGAGCAYIDFDKALAEDECGEDEPWEEDEFWDALDQGEKDDDGEFFDAPEESEDQTV